MPNTHGRLVGARSEPMRVAVLADIGHPAYHVGDEAIAHAVRDELRARGVRPVLLTRDVRHTRTYVGPVSAAPSLAFPWPPREREASLRAIKATLAGDARALPDDDPARAFIETIRGVDALLIAGGGNLTSRYGWLLYERIAAGLIARHFGRPVVLTGQTVGPELLAHDRAELRRLLASCGLVSLREHHSVRLARALVPEHPAVVGGLDDAAAWRLGVQTPVPDAGDGPHVVATLAPGTGGLPAAEAIGLFAGLLDDFALRTGARVTLLPHMALPGRPDGDLAFHAQVATASRSGRLETRPLPTAREAVDAVLGADLVITSRYHPAVFGAMRGVPVFALAPDHYADVRLDGALTHHGLGGWTVPLDALATGAAASALAALWDDRERIRAHLASTLDGLLAAHARRWDDLTAALGGDGPRPGAWGAAPALAPPDAVARARAAHLSGLRRASDAFVAELEAERAQAPGASG